MPQSIEWSDHSDPPLYGRIEYEEHFEVPDLQFLKLYTERVLHAAGVEYTLPISVLPPGMQSSLTSVHIPLQASKGEFWSVLHQTTLVKTDATEENA